MTVALLGAEVLLAVPLQNGVNEDVVTERQMLLFAPVLFGVVGLVLWYALAKGPVNRARMLFGLDAYEPAPGVGREELVAVTGPVRAADETLAAPLTEEDCVAYERSDQTYQHSYRYDEDRRRRMRRRDEEDWDQRAWSWETTSTDTEQVPFEVETEHGAVAVDPEGASTTLPVAADEKSGRLHRLAYALNPLTGRNSLLGTLARFVPGTGHLVPSRPERTVVSHLSPGEEVLVVGDVDRPKGDTTGVVGVVSEDDDFDMYRITTRPLWRLRLGALWSILGASVFGLAFVLAAIGLVIVGVTQGIY